MLGSTDVCSVGCTAGADCASWRCGRSGDGDDDELDEDEEVDTVLSVL